MDKIGSMLVCWIIGFIITLVVPVFGFVAGLIMFFAGIACVIG